MAADRPGRTSSMRTLRRLRSTDVRINRYVARWVRRADDDRRCLRQVLGIWPQGSPVAHLEEAMIAIQRIMGMREAAEIARNFRPASACTCGSYSEPSHQPGCLVGECLAIADEIDGAADELENCGPAHE